MQETRGTRVWPLSWEDAMEEEMATHSRILAWKIPCSLVGYSPGVTKSQTRLSNWAHVEIRAVGSLLCRWGNWDQNPNTSPWRPAQAFSSWPYLLWICERKRWGCLGLPSVGWDAKTDTGFKRKRNGNGAWKDTWQFWLEFEKKFFIKETWDMKVITSTFKEFTKKKKLRTTLVLLLSESH